MRILSSKLNRILLVLATAVLLVVGFYDLAPGAPKISWTPDSLVQIIPPGSTTTINVSFVSSENLSNVTVDVVPALQSFVSVNPAFFGAIGENEVTNLAITITDPGISLVDGTMHIRSGKGKGKTIAQPLPITIEQGGSDSDGDGVWDYVQQYIETTYPNSEKTRAALLQFAEIAQALLLDANDKQASIDNSLESSKAWECLTYVLGIQQARIAFVDLRAEILNTVSKSKAWIVADGHLGGQVYRSTPMNQRKFSCEFDPDAMEN